MAQENPLSTCDTDCILFHTQLEKSSTSVSPIPIVPSSSAIYSSSITETQLEHSTLCKQVQVGRRGVKRYFGSVTLSIGNFRKDGITSTLVFAYFELKSNLGGFRSNDDIDNDVGVFILEFRVSRLFDCNPRCQYCNSRRNMVYFLFLLLKNQRVTVSFNFMGLLFVMNEDRSLQVLRSFVRGKNPRSARKGNDLN